MPPPSIQTYRARAASPGRLTGGRRSMQNGDRGQSAVVTVVTVAFNSIRTIDRTVDSVVAQTCPGVEYIIVDGGSTDGTVERLRSRSGDIDLWISEADNGISDAFNKGIALARGEYVALVNSDDWLEPEHLALAVGHLRESGADFVYGDLMLHGVGDEPTCVLVGEEDYARRVRHSMPQINHPTIVCRRAVYEAHGLFETGYRTAMDYEWLLRGYTRNVRGTHVSGLLSHMSAEGTSHRNYSRGFQEVRTASVAHGYSPALAWLRYVTRLVRPPVRHAIRALIPKSVYAWLRRKVNPQYRSAHSSST